MKFLYKYGPIFFSVIFLGILVLSLKMMVTNPLYNEDSAVEYDEYYYHFGIFVPSGNQSIKRGIIEGANREGEVLNCAISYYSLEEDLTSLKMVSYLGLDGIVIFPFGDLQTIEQEIRHITTSGIPVIQLENEVVRDARTFYIGSNNYETGSSLGKVISTTNQDQLDIVLIYSEKSPGIKSASGLVEMGIRSIIGDQINKLNTYSTNLNPLDGERLAYQILREVPETDIIVLTDPGDTEVAVQAIIDNNKVGVIQVVGFGINEKIEEYLDKGLILGTVVRDYVELGAFGVKGIFDIRNKGYSSAYVNTDIKVIYSE